MQTAPGAFCGGVEDREEACSGAPGARLPARPERRAVRGMMQGGQIAGSYSSCNCAAITGVGNSRESGSNLDRMLTHPAGGKGSVPCPSF
jgi:hypothetical protein